MSPPPTGDVDEHGRTEPPLRAGEEATVLGFLEFQRDTVAWKCSGLDAAGLTATVGPSSMTLGWMLEHLAHVEDLWCSQRLHGRAPLVPPAPDARAGRDRDELTAAGDGPEQLEATWRAAVDRSRSLVAEALADGGLDRPAAWIDDWYGVAPSLRWILLHLVREYARHAGHADLLREAIDGSTGE